MEQGLLGGVLGELAQDGGIVDALGAEGLLGLV